MACVGSRIPQGLNEGEHWGLSSILGTWSEGFRVPRRDQYYKAAAATVLFYDFLLTLSDEVSSRHRGRS